MADSCKMMGVVYQVPVSAGSKELLHWVFGSGANAEVLQPQSLRNRTAETIARMDRAYTGRGIVRQDRSLSMTHAEIVK